MSTVKMPTITLNLYIVAILVLTLLSLLLGLKYLHAKLLTYQYAQATMIHDQMMTDGRVSEEAKIITTTLALFPSDKPLYTQSADVQKYVMTLSKSLQRDMVVVDATGKVLADTLATNINTKYSYDSAGELQMTLKDGISRSFIEISKDYPGGINEIATPIKDGKGTIVGAVLLSTTSIAK